MSAKNKNHNRIIFLTTLSVYLGLVLVGATPQISAQNRKTADANTVNILIPGQGLVLTFDLNPFIELNKLASKETSLTKVSGKLIPLQQEFTDWGTITGTGDQKVIDFLRKEFFTPMQVSPPTLPRSEKELFQTIEIDSENISVIRQVTFTDLKNAAIFEEVFRKTLEYAKSSAADKKIAGNPYITNTQVRSENNQVFIVTRLPRAAIDEFLATNAR